MRDSSAYYSNEHTRKGQKGSKDCRGQNLWCAAVATDDNLKFLGGGERAITRDTQPPNKLRRNSLLRARPLRIRKCAVSGRWDRGSFGCAGVTGIPIVQTRTHSELFCDARIFSG